METKSIFVLFANYNQSLNQKVYDAALKLDNAELSRDRGAFFGSIIGTLNHILVADIIWLNRFLHKQLPGDLLTHTRSLPKPKNLDDILYNNISELYQHRRAVDSEIIELINTLDQPILNAPLTYTNSKGTKFTKQFSSLLLHFFNHQTHHRGQATTLFSQQGISVGVTDLLVMIPDEGIST